MIYPYDISFITINYNGIADTSELIRSLQKVVRSVSYEIIVVDNDSAHDEASRLKECFPDVFIIANKSNLGFAGANNVAVPKAHGRYLFFINNDTLVEEDHFDELIRHMEKNSHIGLICPKLRFTWDNRPIQFAGFTPLSSVTLRNAGIGYGEEDHGQHDKTYPTPFAHGAAMMARRDMLDKAGLMWEGYFLYFEEMDWSEQIRKSGYEIWYDPCQCVFHKESKTIGTESPIKTYYMTRNRLLFARRNRKGMTRILCYAYLTFVSLFIHLPRLLLKGHRLQASSLCRGVKDFYLARCGY